MQHLEGSQQPQRNSHGLGQWQSSLSDPGCQGLAFEQFHSDEVLVFMLADLINGADVGVIQRGGGPRFTPETFKRL